MSSLPDPIYLLGAFHTLVGIFALIAPLATAPLFLLAAVPSATIVTRMLGARDLVLGGFLLSLANAPAEQRRAILVATNIINGIDIVSALVSYMEGNMTTGAWGLLSGAAGGLVGVGRWGMRCL